MSDIVFRWLRRCVAMTEPSRCHIHPACMYCRHATDLGGQARGQQTLREHRQAAAHAAATERQVRARHTAWCRGAAVP